MSSNDIMDGLFRADMLSHSATGQVTLIFISGRNPIYSWSSLTTCLSLRCPQIFMSTV